MKTLLTLIFICSSLISLNAQEKKQLIIQFQKDTPGAQSKSFSSFVGKWYVTKDGKKNVYTVDGRKWMSGTMSSGIADKAKAIYGERYAEFLDNIEAYKYFPLTILNEVKNFSNGELSVKFKTISGRIDQAAGIAFDIQNNGDYLVVRANPLENNIVAFKLNKGKRSVVKWVRNIPTASKKWHTLKLIINNSKVEGLLNNKSVISFDSGHKITGKIGLWSKSDSYVLFNDFKVETH